jgi:hypothetical protein
MKESLPLAVQQAGRGPYPIPNSLGSGVLVARWAAFPFPSFVSAAIKCQMPLKEHISTQHTTHNTCMHMQLGWLARWVLSAPPRPPGHPAAGRCGRRVVPVPPLLLCMPLYSPHARMPFGWGPKPPFRSALAPVESPPRLVLSPVTGLRNPQFLISSHGSQTRNPRSKLRNCSTASQPCVGPLKLLPSPTKSREVAYGLVPDALENGSTQVRCRCCCCCCKLQSVARINLIKNITPRRQRQRQGRPTSHFSSSAAP